MQTHSNTPLGSEQVNSGNFPQGNSSQQIQSSEGKKGSPINLPARALLAALKTHYQVSSDSLAKLGLADGTLNENAYIQSILSKNMSSIFDILANCEPCSQYVQQVLIDDIDIEDIPHEFILESVRRRAFEIFLYG